MEVELKSTVINLYEKLGNANLTREFLTDNMLSVELGNVEKALRSGSSIHLGQCCCKHPDGVPDGSKVCPLDPKGIKCYRCLKEHVSQENKPAREPVDFLGWGLPGLFEQQSSDESTDNTSTDQDVRSERRLSAARHKILRKLRRKKPELFDFNYVHIKSEELLNSELKDSEVRQLLRRPSGQGDKKNDSKHVIPFTGRRRSQPYKEYNVYGEGSYDPVHEIRLKEKYSSAKFDFLTGVIKYYQKYLLKHLDEQYPSVSELILKSGQTSSKSDKDIVAQYYEVLHNKGGQKKYLSSIANNSKEEQDRSKNIVTEPLLSRENFNLYKCDELEILDDIRRAKKTGFLNLSDRSIDVVPYELWTTAKEVMEAKLSFYRKMNGAVKQRRSVSSKPLVYLNLRNNKIKNFFPAGNCLESLNQLCLNNNFIEMLPEEFGSMKNLQILDLENNLLRFIPESFCNLTSLKELHLQKNRLTELPDGFGNLKKLKSIDLRWNKLVKLPDTFEDLESLGNLNIAHNKLRALPMDLNQLYKLIILDVSYNRLIQMPCLTEMPKLILVNAMGNYIKQFPNFSDSKSLCEIRLDGNRIKRIVTDFLKNCPVVQLTLSHNKIVEIPEDFYTIDTLVLLDCTHNRLSILPCSIARLNYLTCIKVEENHIKNVDKYVIDCGSKKILETLIKQLLLYEGNEEVVVKAKQELEVLYVRGETRMSSSFVKDLKLDPKEIAKSRSFIKRRYGLTNLPNEWIQIAEQHKVSLVDISKNKFRYMPAGLKSLRESLKELVIRENCLKTVPDFIGRMRQLNLLDLSFNYLDNLPLSMTSCNLTKLVCRRNLFVMIPKTVYMIQTIQYLDFSENLIRELDIDGLRNLKKLSHLILSKNEIKRLPSSLGFLVNLKQLDVTDNLFKRPGPPIIRGGTQVILEYLRRQHVD